MAGGMAAVAGIAMWLPDRATVAVDHLDPTSRTNASVHATPDRAADIADVYAWHPDAEINLVLTFAGPQATNRPATFDPDVLLMARPPIKHFVPVSFITSLKTSSLARLMALDFLTK